MTQTVEKLFEIPEVNFAEFLEKLAKLNKRAAKLGVIGGWHEVVGQKERVTKDQTTGEIKSRLQFFVVKVMGMAPHYAGWTLAASIEGVQTEDGVEYIIKAVPGMEIPEMYRTRYVCDHCNTIRRRSETHLVVNEAGEYRQVGSSCIKDFLGGISPQTLASMAEMLHGVMAVGEEAEGFGYGGYMRPEVTPVTMMAYTAGVVDEEGWMSRGKARMMEGATATADAVWRYLFPTSREAADPVFQAKLAKITPGDAQVAEAKAALEWVRSFGERDKALDDYEYNLWVACRAITCNGKLAGLVASAIPAYRRHTEREIKRQAGRAKMADSKHVGTVGKREVFTNLQLMSDITWESQWGVTHLYKFMDSQGNVLCWKSSRNAELTRGAFYNIKGTVKTHGDYKGVKETNLTRCEATEVKAEQAA